MVKKEAIGIKSTTHFDIILRNDNVVVWNIKAEDEISLEDFKEAYDLFVSLVEEKKYPCLITFVHDYVPFSKEAREYAATDEVGKYTLCNAIVVSSVPMKLAMNVLIKVLKIKIPTKVFNNEEDAIAWIKVL